MKYLQIFGNLLIFGLKFQAYFFLRVLKGGIIFGIFPAMFGSYKLLTKCLNDKDMSHVSIKQALSDETKSELIKMNILGYGFAFVFYLLGVNLLISRTFIGIDALHWFLIAVIVLMVSLWIYVVVLFTKYELPLRQYILQSFLCSVLGIIETIGIVVTFGFATALVVTIPPLGVFFGVVLITLPHAWFGRTALRRFERVVYQHKTQEEKVDE